MNALFISDLHLCEERPDTIALFYRFLDETAPLVKQLYILGDLFEYWAGDDAITAMHKEVAHRIKRLTQQGVEVFFMPGNRDFLIGKQFTRLCRWKVITDPHIIRYKGGNIVLMHGDTLCTDDEGYMRFRKKYRNRFRIFLFLLLPLKKRLAMIRQFRSLSQGKDESIMDVNEEAVKSAFRRHRAAWMIHGHTHRPATHVYDIDNNESTRYVLADWGRRGQYLQVDNKGIIDYPVLA